MPQLRRKKIKVTTSRRAQAQAANISRTKGHKKIKFPKNVPCVASTEGDTISCSNTKCIAIGFPHSRGAMTLLGVILYPEYTVFY